jgi:hypothetical protein
MTFSPSEIKEGLNLAFVNKSTTTNVVKYGIIVIAILIHINMMAPSKVMSLARLTLVIKNPIIDSPKLCPIQNISPRNNECDILLIISFKHLQTTLVCKTCQHSKITN